MKLNFKSSVKGIGLGVFMMFGIMAFSTTEANAQWRDRDNDRDERQDDRDYRRDRRDDRDDRYESRNRRNDRDGNNGGYYGNNNVYRVAQRQGYQDGLYRGRDDAQDRDRYNPEKSSEYRKATNGYDSRTGNKNAYKDAYRQAFISGYNQGYNRNGNNGGYNNRRSTGAAILGSILGF